MFTQGRFYGAYNAPRFPTYGLAFASVAAFGLAMNALNQKPTETLSEQHWPVFSKSEIAKHDCQERGVWIVVEDGVYDMTEFVANHPGGKEKIMLAAGKNVAPFWNIYRQVLLIVDIQYFG